MRFTPPATSKSARFVARRAGRGQESERGCAVLGQPQRLKNGTDIRAHFRIVEVDWPLRLAEDGTAALRPASLERTPRGEVSRVTHDASAFTLAEALAALLFLAIVIPIAVQGLHIASLAGEVAHRKSIAAWVAERVLNENVASTNSNQSSQSGKTTEGVLEFNWTLHSEPWAQNATNVVSSGSAGSSLSSGQPIVNASVAGQTTLNLVSVEVGYFVQNRPYSVRLSTLAKPQ